MGQHLPILTSTLRNILINQKIYYKDMKKLFSSGILLLKHPNYLRTFRIMRLTAFLILVFTSFAFAENSHSQNAVVSMNKRQVTLKEVINEIEKQTDYLFLLNRDIDLERKVTVHADNKSVKEVLDKLFTNTNLSYTMEGINIILSQRSVDTSLPEFIQQQKRTITGTVMDEYGEPIIGANVIEKGTTNGVITDIDGKFSLAVADDAIVQVSYIGYLPVEASAKDKNTLTFTLKEDAQTLDEVVVVGFGTQKKVNLTGAISTVKMDDVLGDRPVVSVNQALQGAMPGLQITTNTGKPGEAMTMNVRGTNRINLDEFGAGEPLVLVDNVPMDINMISPADIESVTVLKDAASAAIYGARAAFGVILITTKQAGLEQKTRINYNNNFAFSSPQSMIQKASPMETVQFYKDLGLKSGLYTNGGQNIDDWLGYLKDYQNNPSKYPLGYYIAEDGKRYDLKETDHSKRMMDDYGFQQTHNLSIDGGTQKSAYRVSFGYMDEDGILITDKDRYQRYNISSFVRSDVTSWMTFNADIKYSNAKTTYPNMQSVRNWPSLRLAQLLPTYYPEGETEIDGETLPIGTPRWNILNSPTQLTKQEDIRLFGKLILKLLPGLNVNAEYTFNRINRNKETYQKVLKLANGEPTSFSTIYTHGNNSQFKQEERHTNYNAINIYANYDKTFGEHQIALMGGFNQEYSYMQDLWGQKLNVVNQENPSLTGAGGTQTTGDGYDEFAVRGLFYRVSYNYKGKYLLETNGRYDGSSKFPENNRFGFFPSVSAAWRISEEPFMDWSKDYLDNLKIRGSFGQVGNQAIKNYAYLGTMGTADGWLADGIWNIARNAPGLFSSSFTWEKVETLDFGFDLTMFNNRLDLTFDWYRRDTKGMLAPGQELPSVLGGTAPLENSADMRTTGWELGATWRDRIGKDWRYSIGFNIYDSQAKITKFDNPTNTLGDKTYRVGQKVGEIWGLITDRFYTEDDFSFIDDVNGVYTLKEGIPKLYPQIRDPRPGDILYKDLDGDGKIDRTGDGTADNPGDRRIIGNNTRRYPYSINASVGWKGFDLSVFFSGVGKRDLVIGTGGTSNFLAWPHTNTDNPNAAATVLKHHLDYWTPDNRNAYYPRLGDQNGINQGTDSYNRQTQTKYLADASYIKLKNITLSYTFPRPILDKIRGINSLKVFFSGEDLWTKHHMFKGMDPEQTFVVNDLYPFMKKISFGINVTL